MLIPSGRSDSLELANMKHPGLSSWSPAGGSWPYTLPTLKCWFFYSLHQCLERASSSCFAHWFGDNDCVLLTLKDSVTTWFFPETSGWIRMLEIKPWIWAIRATRISPLMWPQKAIEIEGHRICFKSVKTLLYSCGFYLFGLFLYPSGELFRLKWCYWKERCLDWEVRSLLWRECFEENKHRTIKLLKTYSLQNNK